MSVKYRNQSSPWGFFPVSPVELKTSVSLKRYVFQAAGVLICKAHYSNKTLKRVFDKPMLSACFHSSTNSTNYRLPVKLQSPKSRFINCYFDFNFYAFIMSLHCELGHSFLALCRFLTPVLAVNVEVAMVLKDPPGVPSEHCTL